MITISWHGLSLTNSLSWRRSRCSLPSRVLLWRLYLSESCLKCRCPTQELTCVSTRWQQQWTLPNMTKVGETPQERLDSNRAFADTTGSVALKITSMHTSGHRRPLRFRQEPDWRMRMYFTSEPTPLLPALPSPDLLPVTSRRWSERQNSTRYSKK